MKGAPNMVILKGTDTRGPINLSFTRAEFDELISLVDIAVSSGNHTKSRSVGLALLAFRETFVDSEGIPNA